MGTRTRSRLTYSATMMVFALVASGCQVLFTGAVGGGGSGTPCYQGTWDLSGQQITGAVTSVFGDLTVTPDGSGLTLELRADDTFTFSGDQTVTVSGTTPYGTINGVVNVAPNVDGVYTAGANTLTFTPESISGTGQFSGSFNGLSFSTSFSLEQIGLDEIYELSGTATRSCSSNQLTLDFGDVSWDF